LKQPGTSEPLRVLELENPLLLFLFFYEEWRRMRIQISKHVIV